jgi:hypothetical protein
MDFKSIQAKAEQYLSSIDAVSILVNGQLITT